jgi:hypothetical protein
MKHGDEADQAIDKVLAGLREVTAPVGMERRILEAAEARAAARGTWGWRMPLACAMGLAAVVLALAAIHRVKPTVPPVSLGAKAIPMVLMQPSVAPVKLAVARSKSAVRRKQVVPALDARTLSDVQAPSFPAPPIPLTEQEKLLVQVAERGQPKPIPVLDAKPLPMLDPDGMAKQEAQTEIHFQQQLVAQSADVEQMIEMMQQKGDRR